MIDLTDAIKALIGYETQVDRRPSSPQISVFTGWSARLPRRQPAFPPEDVPPLSDEPGEIDITPSVRGEDVGAVLAAYEIRGRAA